MDNHPNETESAISSRTFREEHGPNNTFIPAQETGPQTKDLAEPKQDF